jgi:hypothetical protein
MFEAKKPCEAHDFIARELKTHGIGKINTFIWSQGPHDAAAAIYRLTVFCGREKTVLPCTEYELFENYGSKQWETELRGYIVERLMEF